MRGPLAGRGSVSTSHLAQLTPHDIAPGLPLMGWGVGRAAGRNVDGRLDRSSDDQVARRQHFIHSPQHREEHHRDERERQAHDEHEQSSRRHRVGVANGVGERVVRVMNREICDDLAEDAGDRPDDVQHPGCRCGSSVLALGRAGPRTVAPFGSKSVPPIRYLHVAHGITSYDQACADCPIDERAVGHKFRCFRPPYIADPATGRRPSGPWRCYAIVMTTGPLLASLSA